MGETSKEVPKMLSLTKDICMGSFQQVVRVDDGGKGMGEEEGGPWDVVQTERAFDSEMKKGSTRLS